MAGGPGTCVAAMEDILDLVVVTADGAGVPIIFPVHNDGVAVVLACRLSLRF